MPSRSSSGDTHRREEHMSIRSTPDGACWTNDRIVDRAPTSQRDVSFVRVGALRLRISRQGHGPPLLLLGGLGNSLGVWDNLVGELPDLDTIAVDAPGTGSSSTPALPLSMAELADVYASLVRSLELEKVSVLGLSFGGRCRAATRLPITRAGQATGAVRNRSRCRRAPRGTCRSSGARIAGAVLQCGTITAGHSVDLRGSICARTGALQP